MSVVLTGASGFLGNFLVDILDDVKVIGRSKPEFLSDELFLKADIRHEINCSSFISGSSVVIHCAARVHVMNETNNDKSLAAFRRVNTEGTINLAKEAVKAGCKRFIFISSIKVNGGNTSNSFAFQSIDVPNPSDPYGISKFEAEEKLIELSKNTGLEIVIIRPPLVYGEGVKANFSSLFKLVGKRIPLPFRSVNNNKRSLVSVYNLVDLIKVCIEHPKAINQVFLVSDDNDISTSYMVALMARVQGVNNYSLPFPVWCFNFLGRLLNKQDVVDRLVGSLQVDITHTKETLDWKPPYSVEEGFAKCVENKKGKK